MSSSAKFDSEGFDLSASNNGNAIYEIGGGITTNDPSSSAADSPPLEPTAESERLKERGNDHFRQGNHLDAFDYYTDAIEAAPYGEGIGPRGDELLRLQREFNEAKRQRNIERHRLKTRRGGRDDDGDDEDKKDDNNNSNKDDHDKTTPEEEFDPPRHIYGHKLAVYHANRAATLLHMNRLDEAIDDCTISLLYNPTYTKAYLRRSTAHERNSDTESALLDTTAAYKLQPCSTTKKQMDRLQKIEAERMEKLKEETMGKLKELGNSILGNFGLSLDNFQAVQDPKTGGYSISFNQNK